MNAFPWRQFQSLIDTRIWELFKCIQPTFSFNFFFRFLYNYSSLYYPKGSLWGKCMHWETEFNISLWGATNFIFQKLMLCSVKVISKECIHCFTTAKHVLPVIKKHREKNPVPSYRRERFPVHIFSLGFLYCLTHL